MKFYFLTLSILLSVLLKAQDKTTRNTQNDTLVVLSWNIYCLPGITNISKQIKASKKRKRVKEIAKYILSSNIDIVVFQEAFFPPARKTLAKLLNQKYPFQYGPANKPHFLNTSSGIFVVSNTPLKILEEVKYKACNGVDCFANKGAMLLEGFFNETKFQILGTHLNAGGPQWIRKEQYKQINTLLNTYNKLDVPQIVCGDMNTHKESLNDYQEMLTTLKVEDTPTTSIQKNTTVKNRSIIDYILLNTNGSNIKNASKEVLWIPSSFNNAEVLKGNLSDHLALKATFYWDLAIKR